VSALNGFTVAQDSYTSAKGALISLTKSLAIQFARQNVRCNIIHPGIIETPMQAPYLKDPGRSRAWPSSSPPMIPPNVTGAEIVADGGFTAQ
jgi:NAD(P)-dependent dehydrogenase (short-subunit alcohol dehydrogenase family)